MKKILEIYHGWKNYFFRKIDIEVLHKQRLVECKKCEYYKCTVCTRCGCPGAGKTRSPESKCPENKWKDGWNVNIKIIGSIVPMGDYNSSDDLLNSKKFK